MTMQPVQLAKSRIEDVGQMERDFGPASGVVPRADVRPLRIGLVDLARRAPHQDRTLVDHLRCGAFPVTPIRIGLASWTGGAFGMGTFNQAIDSAPLDGLVVTGALNDAVPLERQPWWGELSEILSYARAFVPSTLGLSAGGLVLAKLLGFEPTPLDRPLLGLFPLLHLDRDAGPDESPRPGVFSRRSTGPLESTTISSNAPNEMDGCHSSRIPREAGYSIFESADRRYVAHLGLPDADPEGLLLVNRNGGGAYPVGAIGSPESRNARCANQVEGAPGSATSSPRGRSSCRTAHVHCAPCARRRPPRQK